MRLSGSLAAVTLAGLAVGGCSGRPLPAKSQAAHLAVDGGGGAGGNLLSDFEDPALAVITRNGSPPRNGSWYLYYGRGVTTCTQLPAAGEPFQPEAPPTPAPGNTGSLALHVQWSSCLTGVAGAGADFNVPLSDGWSYPSASDPKAAYDISAYSGVTFAAMAEPLSTPVIRLRLRMPMRATTPIPEGGQCGKTNCGDEWGERFDIPYDGRWHRFTVRFEAFKQEGWGSVFPWNPADVTGMQIQSVDEGLIYDFWIDDVSLVQ